MRKSEVLRPFKNCSVHNELFFNNCFVFYKAALHTKARVRPKPTTHRGGRNFSMVRGEETKPPPSNSLQAAQGSSSSRKKTKVKLANFLFKAERGKNKRATTSPEEEGQSGELNCDKASRSSACIVDLERSLPRSGVVTNNIAAASAPRPKSIAFLGEYRLMKGGKVCMADSAATLAASQRPSRPKQLAVTSSAQPGSVASSYQGEAGPQKFPAGGWREDVGAIDLSSSGDHQPSAEVKGSSKKLLRLRRRGGGKKSAKSGSGQTIKRTGENSHTGSSAIGGGGDRAERAAVGVAVGSWPRLNGASVGGGQLSQMPDQEAALRRLSTSSSECEEGWGHGRSDYYLEEVPGLLGSRRMSSGSLNDLLDSSGHFTDAGSDFGSSGDERDDSDDRTEAEHCREGPADFPMATGTGTTIPPCPLLGNTALEASEGREGGGQAISPAPPTETAARQSCSPVSVRSVSNSSSSGGGGGLKRSQGTARLGISSVVARQPLADSQGNPNKDPSSMLSTGEGSGGAEEDEDAKQSSRLLGVTSLPRAATSPIQILVQKSMQLSVSENCLTTTTTNNNNSTTGKMEEALSGSIPLSHSASMSLIGPSKYGSTAIGGPNQGDRPKSHHASGKAKTQASGRLCESSTRRSMKGKAAAMELPVDSERDWQFWFTSMAQEQANSSLAVSPSSLAEGEALPPAIGTTTENEVNCTTLANDTALVGDNGAIKGSQPPANNEANDLAVEEGSTRPLRNNRRKRSMVLAITEGSLIVGEKRESGSSSLPGKKASSLAHGTRRSAKGRSNREKSPRRRGSEGSSPGGRPDTLLLQVPDPEEGGSGGSILGLFSRARRKSSSGSTPHSRRGSRGSLTPSPNASRRSSHEDAVAAKDVTASGKSPIETLAKIKRQLAETFSSGGGGGKKASSSPADGVHRKLTIECLLRSSVGLGGEAPPGAGERKKPDLPSSSDQGPTGGGDIDGKFGYGVAVGPAIADSVFPSSVRHSLCSNDSGITNSTNNTSLYGSNTDLRLAGLEEPVVVVTCSGDSSSMVTLRPDNRGQGRRAPIRPLSDSSLQEKWDQVAAAAGSADDELAGDQQHRKKLSFLSSTDLCVEGRIVLRGRSSSLVPRPKSDLGYCSITEDGSVEVGKAGCEGAEGRRAARPPTINIPPLHPTVTSNLAMAEKPNSPKPNLCNPRLMRKWRSDPPAAGAGGGRLSPDLGGVKGLQRSLTDMDGEPRRCSQLDPPLRLSESTSHHDLSSDQREGCDTDDRSVKPKGLRRQTERLEPRSSGRQTLSKDDSALPSPNARRRPCRLRHHYKTDLGDVNLEEINQYIRSIHAAENKTDKSSPEIQLEGEVVEGEAEQRLPTPCTPQTPLRQSGLVRSQSTPCSLDRGPAMTEGSNSGGDTVNWCLGEKYMSESDACSSDDEDDTLTYAEALWDHVTMEEDELGFKAGDLIEVVDMNHRDWWWGYIEDRQGWFPAAFVRRRVGQTATVEECMERMREGVLGLDTRRHMRRASISLLSKSQVRSKVIKEILSTEKDYVQNLKDVCEGYVKPARKRPEMFTEAAIQKVFGNIEDIYSFHCRFLDNLNNCIDKTKPHLSEIGFCFLEHIEGFKIYSEYCNNHPTALSELRALTQNPKYGHFFEACRLLQEMIEISLDGFLLTPVQKICKYPLQLGELLKYTDTSHSDYKNVEAAHEAMKNVAMLINERKRRMESIEKIANWQNTIEGWEGDDVLEMSTELIYSGDIQKIPRGLGRGQARKMFLFDHQLVYCKKDLLKRDQLSYKGKILLDCCRVHDVEDGKDNQWGISVKNAWKVHDTLSDRWYMFAVKTNEEKLRWMKAFADERTLVQDDREKGLAIPVTTRKATMLNKQRTKDTSKPSKERNSGNFAYLCSQQELLDAQLNSTIALPEGISSEEVLGNFKKKNWFHFGARKVRKS